MFWMKGQYRSAPGTLSKSQCGYCSCILTILLVLVSRWFAYGVNNDVFFRLCFCRNIWMVEAKDTLWTAVCHIAETRSRTKDFWKPVFVGINCQGYYNLMFTRLDFNYSSYFLMPCLFLFKCSGCFFFLKQVFLLCFYWILKNLIVLLKGQMWSLNCCLLYFLFRSRLMHEALAWPCSSLGEKGTVLCRPKKLKWAICIITAHFNGKNPFFYFY